MNLQKLKVFLADKERNEASFREWLPKSRDEDIPYNYAELQGQQRIIELLKVLIEALEDNSI